MRDARTMAAWITVASMILLPVAAYVGAYYSMCETFGSASFQVPAATSRDITITWNGPPFLDRMYPNQRWATFFAPAAKLETWLTGVNVCAVDRSRVGFDFDFTIEDHALDIPPP